MSVLSERRRVQAAIPCRSKTARARSPILHQARDGIAFNKHFARDGAIIFKRLHARLYPVKALRFCLSCRPGRLLAEDQEPDRARNKA
jgi:hypothetical protein